MQFLRKVFVLHSSNKLRNLVIPFSLCTNFNKINTSKVPYKISMATAVFDQICLENYVNKYNKNSYATTVTESDLIDSVTFEKVCEETLDSLCEYFEGVIEGAPHLNSSDVSYGSGVLTINFGQPYGTYVINRQSPNRQIWLSSPTSGPKRYDYVFDGGYWVYKHNGQTLHQLLQNEIPPIVKVSVDFSTCLHSHKK